MRPFCLSGTSLIALGSAALLALACGGEDLGPEPDTGLRLQPPTLKSIAPDSLSVGDEVTVLAEDLPDSRTAETKLRLDGIYTTASGKEYHFEGDLPIEVENPCVAKWRFEELLFDPNQDETGTWKGTASLVVIPKGSIDDVGEDFEPLLSNEVSTNLRVGPSIVLDTLHSIEGQGCADVTLATNANHELAISFRAIGLGEASSANPWTFKVQFASPDLKVRYIKEDALGGFDGSIIGDALLDDTVSTDAKDGQNRIAVIKTDGDSLEINPHLGITTVTINPPVEIGLNLYDEVVIGRIAAGPLDEQFGRKSANIVLEIVAQDGRSLRRAVNFGIYNEVEIARHSSPAQLVERYEPEQVCGCTPGGQNGRELQYSEGQSISKSRSLNYRWDQNVSANLGFNIGSFQPVIQASGSETWTESFGVDINESVSSEVHSSLNISAHIIPTWNGTCYRQLEELEKTVDIIYHNACGRAGVVGEAVLTDYNFSFDVASGPECPPQTELPPAESFR